MYVATINVPGYLPMDDEPPTFETAQAAWEYLADERDRSWDDVFAASDLDTDDDTLTELRRRASDKWLVCDFERVGTVYGGTPGYDGSHDLGLAYSVTETDDRAGHCCAGWFNGSGVECDDECQCPTCVEQHTFED